MLCQDVAMYIVCLLILYASPLILFFTFSLLISSSGWLGSRVVSVLDSGAEGPGSNHSLLSGNSLIGRLS